MRIGKLSETIRKRSVLKKIAYQSPKLVCGPAAWQRCGRYDVGDAENMIFSVQTATGEADILADKTFWRTANRIAADGAALCGVIITLYLPEKTDETGLRKIVGRLAELAASCRVDILETHIEVMSTVTQPVLSLTGVGLAGFASGTADSKISPGSDIVMTKWAGAAGAAEAVITGRHSGKDGLHTRFSADFLEQTQRQFEWIDSVPDAKTAVDAGVHMLYCAGEDGVFDALWELGEACGSGLEVDLKKIPIRQETVEICEFFDWNPYMIASDGVLLAVTPHGEQLVETFSREGIPSAVIGKITGERGRVVKNRDERRFLAPKGSSMTQ